MSGFTASILSLLVGLIFLIIRLFFFVDLNEIEKSKLNQLKSNSFSLIFSSILFLIIGIVLFAITYPKIDDPINTITNDILEVKYFIGGFFVFLGIVFSFYRDKIFISWGKNGYKVPSNTTKYKNTILFIGIILILIGVTLFLL